MSSAEADYVYNAGYKSGYTAGQADTKPKPCGWIDDGQGNFTTPCGECFLFIEGGPKENGFKYCPYCGGELRVLG